MRSIISISNFYHFFPIDEAELAVKRLSLESRAAKLDIGGLIILAPEGINGTISGNWDDVADFEKGLTAIFGVQAWKFKKSRCTKPPFRDFRVKVRPEIVTLGGPELVRVEGEPQKLSPEQWHKALQVREDFVLLDVRNSYESEIGAFRGAIVPPIENFSDFPDYVEKCGFAKNKKVLMYCTGGIRCEKAALVMNQQGYNEVYQLDGGILNYLEEFPHQEFQGQCFVFDGRVAVDQNLNPTKIWKFCPHCGQPAKDEIVCEFCSSPAVVCQRCLTEPKHRTCSHDCAYKIVHHPTRRSAMLANAAK